MLRPVYDRNLSFRLQVLVKTMTMLALVLAPAYNQFATQSFGVTGSVIAVLLALLVGTASYFLVSHFRRINAVKQETSIRKKKEADARYLAEGGEYTLRALCSHNATWVQAIAWLAHACDHARV